MTTAPFKELAGAQLGLEPAKYFSAPGLSNSGMSDLLVSPLRYWFKQVNPAREPEEPTPQMRFGSALHCAVLEPDQFDKRYACELNADDYDGCLVTIQDCRQWLEDKGIKAKGTRKADVIAQVQAKDPDWPIFDVLQARHLEQHAGKTLFSMDDWLRIQRAAEALKAEPRVSGLLSNGQAEVSILGEDPEFGIPLKARLDWVTPTHTLDLKTFTQTRGKSIDKTVTDAIWYEGYYRQAYFYTWMRTLLGGFDPKKSWPTFVFAFVESDEPHEVRLRALRPTSAGQPNLYWDRGRMEVRALIRKYADYWERFGEKPWRDQQEIDPLIDEEIPQLLFGR